MNYHIFATFFLLMTSVTALGKELTESYQGTTQIIQSSGILSEFNEKVSFVYPLGDNNQCNRDFFRVDSEVSGKTSPTFFDDPKPLNGKVQGLSYRTVFDGVEIGRMNFYGRPCGWTSWEFNKIETPGVFRMGGGGITESPDKEKVFWRHMIYTNAKGEILQHKLSRLNLK